MIHSNYLLIFFIFLKESLSAIELRIYLKFIGYFYFSIHSINRILIILWN